MHFSHLTTLIAVLSSVVTYVNADAAITAPLGASWKAGSSNIITWTENNEGEPMPATFDISLMQGKPTSLQLVSTIASSVDSASGQYKWDIPAGQAPANDYSIRLGNPPVVFYSPAFEIVAGGVAPPASSNTTTPSQPSQSPSNTSQPPQSSSNTVQPSKTPSGSASTQPAQQSSGVVVPSKSSVAQTSNGASTPVPSVPQPTKTPSSGGAIIRPGLLIGVVGLVFIALQ
ncbi:hypothetical protein K7432_001726 [Basidiobolus ranarum]|uniref:Yeast cell wall synthesis Kre9/Knh1-like N-terminal domain-containing protein n=1 Tax=Basidiobolus ranarum TaxID=34480 RepID=A0ABR2X2V8_9FUNG